MNGLGKGIAIAACAVAIAVSVWITKMPVCLFAFIPVAWMANDWKTEK